MYVGARNFLINFFRCTARLQCCCVRPSLWDREVNEAQV